MSAPPLTFGKWRGLARIADAGGRFKMLAADQRPPLQKLVAAKKRGGGAADVGKIKRAIVAELSPYVSAVLLDPVHALPGAAFCLAGRAAHCGLIATLEDDQFAEVGGGGGRVTSAIANWSVEKIKRAGADAVKILVWYHPQAADKARRAQQDFVRAAAVDCARFDIPLVLELLLYPLGGDIGYAEDPRKKPQLVLQSVRDFSAAEFGVDVFKLESPLPAAALPPLEAGGAAGKNARRWFAQLNDAAARPWVVLSAGASAESFLRVAGYACLAGAGGYLAGRAIWLESAEKFPAFAAVKKDLRGRGASYLQKLNGLVDEFAVPWTESAAAKNFAKAAGKGGLCKVYKDFSGK